MNQKITYIIKCEMCGRLIKNIVRDENINEIRNNIESACKKRAVYPDEVKLIAVTKTVEPERIKEALRCGIEAIGENRIQEAAEKFDKLNLKGIEKHFIGSLQTNKVKAAVAYFDVIQSVDSLKLAREIDKRANEAGKIIPIFIEINIGGEEILTKELTTNFWRAPTDNDFGNGMPERCKVWKEASGLHKLEALSVDSSSNPTSISQAAAVAALNSPDEELVKMKNE